MTKRKPRAARIAALRARMPHVPPAVAGPACESFVDGRFSARGGPAALERFYAALEAAGRPPEMATVADFAAAAGNRTGLIILMKALEAHDPSVPLAVARPLRQDWDRWLNSRYNQKPRKGRKANRVALLVEDWPPAWAQAEPLLGQRLRRDGRRYRSLAPKTRADIVQAVGLCAAARNWAADRGTALSEDFTPDLAEAFLRFLFHRERKDRGKDEQTSLRSGADYFHRVLRFGRRSGLMAADADATFGEILTALRSEAADAPPGKHARIRAFLSNHGLVDLLHAADRFLTKAEAMPAHGAAAFRLRRKAAVFALLVNGVDRQGDLSTFHIGREITRLPDGRWSAAFRQGKTGGAKDLGPYWPLTSRFIDAHVLAGRPEWMMTERLRELDGCNLLGLEEGSFSTYHPAALLQEEFGISGHLVRSLVTDLIRVHRPDAAWAVQALLGHSSQWMQSAYRTDFRETAALEKYHRTIENMAVSAA